MTIEIDEHRAIALVREVVAGNEDHIYEYKPDLVGGDDGGPSACVYEYNGSADCLIGQALYKAGAPIEVLRRLNECGAIYSHMVKPLLEEFDIFLTPQAIDVFSAAQGCQDQGDTWGEALRVAERRYSSIEA
jgi:hypothetical protein